MTVSGEPRSITVPNFVKIGCSVAEIFQFFEFSRWPPPPAWIFEIAIFYWLLGFRVSIHICMPNFVNLLGGMNPAEFLSESRTCISAVVCSPPSPNDILGCNRPTTNSLQSGLPNCTCPLLIVYVRLRCNQLETYAVISTCIPTPAVNLIKPKFHGSSFLVELILNK